jgi:hypothetical protein
MATKKGPGGYEGAEKRRLTRRSKGDRRDLVRWEPDKNDRRKGHGRRSTDGLKRPRD